jgi:hypothetical protein
MGSPHKENINMATRMQQRRGTAAQWTAANPILAAGEIGFETDTNKFKMGNGSSTWTALQYFANAAELAAIIDGAPDLLNTLNELAAAIGDDPSFFTSIGQTISNNIDSHNVTTDVHGIDDTSLLATLENVLDAKDEAIADAATAAGEALSSHNNLSTNVHGIVDTSDLTTTSDVSGIVSTHNDLITNVHGIADTSDLTTTSDVSGIVSTHNDLITNVHGIADTSLLATTQNITDHNDETTNVHGIADTALLATEEYVDDQFTTNLGTHVADSINVHGIADTSLLATQDYVDTAVGNSVVDQSLFAGVGIDWNVDTEEFDIDSTVATTTYVGTEIGTHNSDTTSVHGIADTSLLATTADVAAVTKTTLGLGNVDNTSDADKPVSTATVTAIATAKSEAIAEVTAVIDGAPNALNTLNELAAALGDDANFAGTVTTALAAKVDSYTPITQKTASYTLSTLDHRDDLIEMGSASALTLTIPLNSSIAYPVGTSLDILQTGAGQVTIAGAAGVTVNATPGLKLRTQWSSATLFKRAENTWVVYGDLTA